MDHYLTSVKERLVGRCDLPRGYVPLRAAYTTGAEGDSEETAVVAVEHLGTLISSRRLITVVAEEGGGKTTLIRHYLNDWVSRAHSDVLPVYISDPSELTTGNQPPDQIINGLLDKHVRSGRSHNLAEITKTYRLVIFVDPLPGELTWISRDALESRLKLLLDQLLSLLYFDVCLVLSVRGDLIEYKLLQERMCEPSERLLRKRHSSLHLLPLDITQCTASAACYAKSAAMRGDEAGFERYVRSISSRPLTPSPAVGVFSGSCFNPLEHQLHLYLFFDIGRGQPDFGHVGNPQTIQHLLAQEAGIHGFTVEELRILLEDIAFYNYSMDLKGKTPLYTLPSVPLDIEERDQIKLRKTFFFKGGEPRHGFLFRHSYFHEHFLGGYFSRKLQRNGAPEVHLLDSGKTVHPISQWIAHNPRAVWHILAELLRRYDAWEIDREISYFEPNTLNMLVIHYCWKRLQSMQVKRSLLGREMSEQPRPLANGARSLTQEEELTNGATMRLCIAVRSRYLELRRAIDEMSADSAEWDSERFRIRVAVMREASVLISVCEKDESLTRDLCRLADSNERVLLALAAIKMDYYSIPSITNPRQDFYRAILRIFTHLGKPPFRIMRSIEVLEVRGIMRTHRLFNSTFVPSFAAAYHECMKDLFRSPELRTDGLLRQLVRDLRHEASSYFPGET